jgi:hypothetical protein
LFPLKQLIWLTNGIKAAITKINCYSLIAFPNNMGHMEMLRENKYSRKTRKKKRPTYNSINYPSFH